jgi:uncharacterized protein YndB with AHSA1/START domain
MNGKLVTVGDRPAVRFERQLPHSVKRVWRAVTEPAELARWFVVPVEWKPELGEQFGAHGGSVEITELEPPHLITWTWADDRFSFELRPTPEDGCLLVFTHVFNPSYGPPAQHAAGWEAYFSRLDAHLAGGYLSEEDAHEPVPALQQRYADLFSKSA